MDDAKVLSGYDSTDDRLGDIAGVKGEEPRPSLLGLRAEVAVGLGLVMSRLSSVRVLICE